MTAYMVEYDADPGEKESRDCPGYPGGIDICSIRMDEPNAEWVDTDDLTDAEKATIVAAVESRLAEIEEYFTDYDYDRHRAEIEGDNT